MDAQLGNWDDLRFFLALARHGRLASAGEALGVNHTTVFRRLAALEERLGTRLFDRGADGHHLTAAGEEMRVVAEEIEDRVFGLDRQVLGRDQELRGVIRVTTADSTHAIARAFRGFLREHPGVTLEVVVDNRVLSLHRREADVALRAGGRPTEPDVVARQIGAISWAVYAGAGYLADNPRPRRARDLDRCELVTGDASFAHVPAQQWLAAHAPHGRVRYRASNMFDQVRAIAAGIGVGVAPCPLADEEPALTRLFTPAGIDAEPLWLIYHGDLRQTARVRAFIDYLTTAL